MVEAARYVDDLLVVQGGDLFGELLIVSVPVAQLPVVASAESIDMAVFIQGDRVVAPASNFRDVYPLRYVLGYDWLLRGWRGA